MRFQVPQFIEHEAKVIGPLTFRQFIYLGVPAAIGFFLYFLAPFPIFVIVSMLAGTLGFALAFFKAGGRSLPTMLTSFFAFFVSPKRYIWQRGTQQIEQTAPVKYQEQVPKEQSKKQEIQLTQKSKIRDLATRVETNR